MNGIEHDLHAQQEEYHDEFMAFLSDYLPEDPDGDDVYHTTLRGLTQGIRGAADLGTSGAAWLIDQTLSLSSTAASYVLESWKAFKIHLFSWIYGSILYLVAFSILVDLITTRSRRWFWKKQNNLIGWKLQENGFLFGALVTVICWFTPLGQFMVFLHRRRITAELNPSNEVSRRGADEQEKEAENRLSDRYCLDIYPSGNAL